MIPNLKQQKPLSFKSKKSEVLKNKSPFGSETKERIHEVSAGGVVFKRKSNKIFVAMMKDSYGKWTFPKGHVEEGETIEEAAARETLEELGLEEIRFYEPLGKIRIWFKDRYEKVGKLIQKDIHFFLFETRENAQLHPDPTQRAFEAKWIPLYQVSKHSGYADLDRIIQNTINFFT